MASYSAALDRLMTSVRTRLPGALDTAIQNELFIVVDEFLKGSTVWRQMMLVPVQAGTVQYDLALDDQPALMDQLIGVWDVSNSVTPQPNDDNWWVTAVTQGIPVYATMPVPGSLLLKNSPSQAGNYAVITACTANAPTTKDGFPRVPVWICDKYAHTDWLDGLLGKMMSQPAKPYSNQQYAVYHLRRFRTAIARARVQANRENIYRGQRWRFPQNFSVRNFRRG
jgi:hypothetical protein